MLIFIPLNHIESVLNKNFYRLQNVILVIMTVNIMEEQAIIQWVMLGVVIGIMAFDKVKAWQMRNGRKSNPGNPSNLGTPSERMTRLETKVDNIEEDIKGIWRKLDKE